MNADFTSRPDSYNCEKKMSTYVLKYGAAYASEIFHYLVTSNFINKIDKSRPLKVISLGCGFSPDYFAIKKYFEVNNISQPLKYTGVDKSTCWNAIRPEIDECKYLSGDIEKPFTLKSPDVVMICKLFSTLYRNDKNAAEKFLQNIEKVVRENFLPSTILIFVDVNHIDFGRDVFHQKVSSILPNYTQYYFDGYTGNNWTHIPQKELVFEIPPGSGQVLPHSVGKTVVFEYRK